MEVWLVILNVLELSLGFFTYSLLHSVYNCSLLQPASFLKFYGIKERFNPWVIRGWCLHPLITEFWIDIINFLLEQNSKHECAWSYLSEERLYESFAWSSWRLDPSCCWLVASPTNKGPGKESRDALLQTTRIVPGYFNYLARFL